MGGVFSKKKPESRITQHDEAVLQLKAQRDKLRQMRRRIEKNLEREKQLAKQLIAEGRKDRALTLLKKKRAQEKMIENAMAQIDNVETMIHDIEFTQIEQTVMDSLKAGNESLKRMQRLMSIEDVERIMEETREAVEYQHEIDSIVSGALSSTDMDEVEAELDALLAADEQQNALKLPDVPTDETGETVETAEKAEPIKKKTRGEDKQRKEEAQMVPA